MVRSKIAANELTHRGVGFKPGAPATNTQETAAPRMTLLSLTLTGCIMATCTCILRRVIRSGRQVSGWEGRGRRWGLESGG